MGNHSITAEVACTQVSLITILWYYDIESVFSPWKCSGTIVGYECGSSTEAIYQRI